LWTGETRVGIITDAAAAPNPRRVIDRVCRANWTARLWTGETRVGIITDSTSTPDARRIAARHWTATDFWQVDPANKHCV
jgi:hypothetical protein